MTTVSFLPEASQEMIAAAGWYEKQQSGLGIQFIGAVDSAVANISDNPKAYSIWSENENVRKCLLKRFPYAVFYRESGDGLEVVAISHLARSPGYWQNRTE